MLSKLNKILILTLVTIIISFTTGVSVYRHYCSCSNQVIKSVFIESKCNTDHHKTTCHSDEVSNTHHCCKSETPNHSNHSCSFSNSGCCKTEIEIIQIESEYNVSHYKPVSLNIFLTLLVYGTDIVADKESELFTESFYTDTSPPVYGRQFLTAIHQLKFHIPVC